MNDHVKASGASPTGAPSSPALAPPPVVSFLGTVSPLLIGWATGLAIWAAVLAVLIVNLVITQHGGESQRNAPGATIRTENSPPVADDVGPEKIRIERNRIVDDGELRDSSGETLREYLVRKRAVTR